jgi:hypothetical protein
MQEARLGGECPASGGFARLEAVLQDAATRDQQAGVLAFGEWPWRRGTRSSSKDVRLIVIAGAAAIL